MKVSVVIPLQDPTSLSPLDLGEGLEANIAKVAAAGYDGVELAITDPGSIEIQGIKRLLKNYRLDVSALTTGQAYGVDGLSLTSLDEGVRREAIRRIKDHIKLARDLRAVVIIGLIRGEGGRKEAKQLLIEALQECAEFDRKVKLALEPLNRYETKLVNNVDEALEILDQVEMENIGILFDTFHANIEETSMEESIKKADKRLFHVHVADSNRWAPGFGHIDFGQVIKALKEINYQGFLSLESLPKPSATRCIKETVSYLKKLIG
jgi:sugar phosphate isomerase/epimerase